MQNFDVLTWPPQSPNLNLVKHMWRLVKWKVNEDSTLAKGMFQLWERVQASFHSIIHEQSQKFHHSMPNCIQVVLGSKGGWTNY